MRGGSRSIEKGEIRLLQWCVRLRPGEILEGRYRVVRLLGEGGMGAVYEGENLRIGRRVAIKVMHPEFTHDQELVHRFELEARAAARIGSSYVVDVLDLGDGYIVMELLEGESLATRLKARQRMSSLEIASIALQLLEGLAKVHDARILHCDLKPANIFLARAEDGSDFVKILDFGICTFMQASSSFVSSEGDRLLGTIAYMSPEVIARRPIDARTDLYSVGVILYRCAAGVLPYQAKNPASLVLRIQRGARAPLPKLVPGIDRTFAALVDRAMAVSPNARFHDTREMLDAFKRWAASLGRIDRLLADFLEIQGPPTPPPSKPRIPSPARGAPNVFEEMEAALIPTNELPTRVRRDPAHTHTDLPGPRDSLLDPLEASPFWFPPKEPPTRPKNR